MMMPRRRRFWPLFPLLSCRVRRADRFLIGRSGDHGPHGGPYKKGGERVIRAVLAQENNPLGPNGESVGQMLVEAACQFLPQATVSEVLMGTPPR